MSPAFACGFAAAAAMLFLPSLLSFAILIAVWMEPLARAFAPLEMWCVKVLPAGESWALARVSSPLFQLDSGNVFSFLVHNGWASLPRWLDATPWPAFMLLLLFAIRLAAWAAVRQVVLRNKAANVNIGLRAGSVAESTAFVSWAALVAISWRFWWGMTWDRLSGGNGELFFPTETDGAHIGVVCVGAAIGYAWTIAFLVRRSIARSAQLPRCVNCGYSLVGLPTCRKCPECGHDPSQKARRGVPAWIVHQLKRNGALLAAGLLLVAPYLSTLVAAVWMRL